MQRNPDYLYRIVRDKDDRWLVQAYLEQDTGAAQPRASFTDEALPDWIRKDVALLSMVDPMGEINGIGHRVGEAFWLVSENSKRLVRRREVIIAMAADQMYASFGLSQGRFFGGIK